MSYDMVFDARGREIPDPMPSNFYVPIQRKISTLDFHRQKLLEQKALLRSLLEEYREDGVETFAEANDFAVEDDFDEGLSQRTDFELDDDAPDGLTAFAQRVVQENMAKARGAGQKHVASTERQSPPESGA